MQGRMGTEEADLLAWCLDRTSVGNCYYVFLLSLKPTTCPCPWIMNSSCLAVIAHTLVALGHLLCATLSRHPKTYDLKIILTANGQPRENDQPSGLLSNSFELNNSLCFVLNTSLNLESNRILLKKIRDYLHLSASISYHIAGSLTFEWKDSNGFVSNRSCIL